MFHLPGEAGEGVGGGSLLVGVGGVVGVGDIVQEAGLGIANGGGSVPERWGDHHDAGAFLADDDGPGGVGVLVIDTDLDVAEKADPEVGLFGMAVPSLDHAGVLDGEVDLALGSHDALELVHERPAAVVGEVLGGHEERDPLGGGLGEGIGDGGVEAGGGVDLHAIFSGR